MGARLEREVGGDNAVAHRQVELLRVELERKQKELDDLLTRSETLHPSAYGALQGQLEEELDKLQAELNSLTAEFGQNSP
ncbi:MAG: hypothetical protein HYZ50_12045 [Deltaproteobacteria bacterium]|nr:hypothetical protein [Deltaproteobacteria bacterium]